MEDISCKVFSKKLTNIQNSKNMIKLYRKMTKSKTNVIPKIASCAELFSPSKFINFYFALHKAK